jgi:hypothetical protein
LHATASCDQHQFLPVFFLTNNNQTTPACSAPRHLPIAISVASLTNDYPCPDPTFKPAPGQSLFCCSTASRRTICRTSSATPACSSRSISCITGSWQPAVVDAYFIMLKPLPPGSHSFSANIVNKAGKSFPTTVDFVVN